VLKKLLVPGDKQGEPWGDWPSILHCDNALAYLFPPWISCSDCFQTQDCAWVSVSCMLRTLNYEWESNDTPVHDFKKCFEQWAMCWKHSKELGDITLKNSRLLISTVLKLIFNKIVSKVTWLTFCFGCNTLNMVKMFREISLCWFCKMQTTKRFIHPKCAKLSSGITRYSPQ
jgi:hypothetical protein